MRPHDLFLPALLIAAIPLPGFSALPASPVKSVASVAPSPETPFTARIAPSSNLSAATAHFVAAQLAPVVSGTEVFTVLPTGSMRPTFDANTVLLTEPAAFQDLEIGDIVVFLHRKSGQRIVHRILERRDGGYWTKGDRGRRMDDELVTSANYLGRVYGIIYTRKSGKAPTSAPPPVVAKADKSGPHAVVAAQ